MSSDQLKRLVTEVKAQMTDLMTATNTVIAGLNRLDDALGVQLREEAERPRHIDELDVTQEPIEVFLSAESRAGFGTRITQTSAYVLMKHRGPGPLENMDKARLGQLRPRRNGKTPGGITVFNKRFSYEELIHAEVIPERFGAGHRISYDSDQFRRFLVYCLNRPPRRVRRSRRNRLRSVA